MDISIDIDYLSYEDKISMLEELVNTMYASDLIKGLSTTNIADIVNELNPLQLDDVIADLDQFVISSVKDTYLNEEDCANFINDTDPIEMQHFVDNLTDDTRKALFDMLDIKVNPHA